MAVDTALRDALASRDRLMEAEDRAEELRIAYHQSIRRLHAAAASMREIADALGLSHQRVHQIVNGSGDMTTSAPKRRGTLLRRLTGRARRSCDVGDDAGRAFDRLSVDARNAMFAAGHEARALKHDYVGTEHVLLGLIRTEGGLAPRVLAASGLDLQGTREAIQRKLGRSTRGGSAATVQMTPTGRVKKVLELSVREAKEHRSTHVRSEHLLLALAQEGEGVGARILAEHGIVYRSLRRRIDRASIACSFCGRGGADVDHLVAGPGVYICEHCVDDVEAGRAPERLRIVPEGDSSVGCSFCGKRRADVDRLVAGPGGRAICDTCLFLCREIHAEERRG